MLPNNNIPLPLPTTLFFLIDWKHVSFNIVLKIVLKFQKFQLTENAYRTFIREQRSQAIAFIQLFVLAVRYH